MRARMRADIGIIA